MDPQEDWLNILLLVALYGDARAFKIGDRKEKGQQGKEDTIPRTKRGLYDLAAS